MKKEKRKKGERKRGREEGGRRTSSTITIKHMYLGTALPNHDIIMTSYLFIQGLVVVKERLECLQHLHLRAYPRIGRLSLDYCHTQ